jgi:hypothetical protein
MQAYAKDSSKMCKMGIKQLVAKMVRCFQSTFASGEMLIGDKVATRGSSVVSDRESEWWT